MQLYLLRHGDAVDLAAGGYARDADRRLSEAGQAEVRAVTAGLERLDLKLDLLLSSPLTRAWQTAAIVAERLPVGRGPVVCPALVPDGDLSGALTAARGAGRVMLVGHLPLLGEMIGWLLWGDPSLGTPLRTAGLCRIDLDDQARPGDGELRWFLPPRLTGRLR